MTALEKFSDNQVKALRALVQHGTVADAATQSGLSERTIRRYREEAEFSMALVRLRGALLSEVGGMVLSSGSEAVEAYSVHATPKTTEGDLCTVRRFERPGPFWNSALRALNSLTSKPG